MPVSASFSPAKTCLADKKLPPDPPDPREPGLSDATLHIQAFPSHIREVLGKTAHW